MLQTRKLSDVIGLQVFTDAGDLFGEVEEAIRRADQWRSAHANRFQITSSYGFLSVDDTKTWEL